MTTDISPWRYCVAPMLDWTDRHCRYFHRLLSQHARLYTEMVASPALVFGDREKLLQHEGKDAPCACQLGGSNPEELARCARWVEEAGYQEVNLNCGCPSERVQKGSFGACLMLDPQLVAEDFAAMREAVQIPVTIKHRVGVDKDDSYDFVCNFVGRIYEAGCRVFIVHARAAWLKGLSPKENRDVPPLHYDYAARLKKDFPDATIVINGGIKTNAQGVELLQGIDGVMVGRTAYNDPWQLVDVDHLFFGDDHSLPTRWDIIEGMTEYLHRIEPEGYLAIHATLVHMLGLMNGIRGAKAWRRILSDTKATRQYGPEILHVAAKAIEFSPASTTDL